MSALKRTETSIYSTTQMNLLKRFQETHLNFFRSLELIYSETASLRRQDFEAPLSPCSLVQQCNLQNSHYEMKHRLWGSKDGYGSYYKESKLQLVVCFFLLLLLFATIKDSDTQTISPTMLHSWKEVKTVFTLCCNCYCVFLPGLETLLFVSFNLQCEIPLTGNAIPDIFCLSCEISPITQDTAMPLTFSTWTRAWNEEQCEASWGAGLMVLTSTEEKSFISALGGGFIVCTNGINNLLVICFMHWVWESWSAILQFAF